MSTQPSFAPGGKIQAMPLFSQISDEPDDSRISLAEILSALSFALDLTEGAVQGHAVRSCLLGMRIGREAGLSEAELFDLYYALLLKDIGCSSNSARMCQIVGGSDIAMKAGAKLVDWTRPHKPNLEMLQILWKNVLPEGNAAQRIVRLVEMSKTQHKNNEEMIALRCDRGASIVRKLACGDRAAEAVRCLDEHWDGSGYPDRLVGEAVPRLSRILAIAQHLDVFSMEKSCEAAIDVLRERSGRWFDPELVRVAISLHRKHRLWANCLRGGDVEETRQAVVDIQPGRNVVLQSEWIDQICEAFADVVDAKSPFTFRHSVGVTNAATLIARELGLPNETLNMVRRAALLHDIGKLGISNSILDKPGKLTDGERSTIEGHPDMSRRILERVGAFRRLAVVAGEHHERLDGTGYPDHKVADVLSLESRIIGVADVYGALSEDRPYRGGLAMEKIVSIMTADLPHRLDPLCFEALMSGLARSKAAAAAQDFSLPADAITRVLPRGQEDRGLGSDAGALAETAATVS
jgi:putative nucleotidyltransferase with HDIG domain